MLLLLFTGGSPPPLTGPGTGQNYGLLLALVSEGTGFTDVPFILRGLPSLA